MTKTSRANQKADQLPKGYIALTVTDIRHFTDKLFAFKTTRPATFRFRSGEFAMIGLEVGGKPLMRAYSIASPNWEDYLEFYSIKVPDGPLTSRLQHLKVQEYILLRPKPVGTLVFDALLPGKRLFLLSTGTGIAPFASIVRDPEVYEKFDHIYLLHTCRDIEELVYGKLLIKAVKDHAFLGKLAEAKLHHLAATTREPSAHMGRINTWIDDGRLATFAGGTLTPDTDRVMICGSMMMLETLKSSCEKRGFREGSKS